MFPNPLPDLADKYRGSQTSVNERERPSACILVVDDEEMNRDVLSRRLRRSGFAVETASSGFEAMESVRLRAYDLVLLDQMMPGLSGSEVLSCWRADPIFAALPVVMVTAVAESDKIAAALESGANDYITKPIDFKVALARIQTQLSRRQAESALRKSEERYALAVKASRDGLWDWDLKSGKIYYAPRWKEMLGLPEDENSQTQELWLSRVLPSDQTPLRDALQEAAGGATSLIQSSYRVIHTDGTLRWMSCRGVVTRDSEGRPTRISGSQSDVTDERTRDGLTHLPNRVFLLSYLERSSAGGAEASHAILSIDVSNFKTVNDSLGHLAGDQLLRSVAARLESVVARFGETTPGLPAPLCARMGGDEFAILVQSGASATAIQGLAEQLQSSMRDPFYLGGRSIYNAISIGVALARGGNIDPEHILREADAALYEAKARGRGATVFFEPAMHEAAVVRFELENDLREAVARNQLAVYYQVKVDLEDKSAYGVEALVRWKHPERGLLAPGMFIPLAEETGLIVDIGRWVLREACQQVRSWQKQFPMAPLFELSVNLSPKEFQEPELVSGIARILEETSFPASSLHLEVTENALFENLASANEILRELKQLGIRLDIDDFGTGYASLRYLRELPFDLIKIDRYFTQSLNTDGPASEQLIETIVSMANALGMDTVAEGVETEPHCAILRRLGCRLGQGFYFSEPIDAQRLETFLNLQLEREREAQIGYTEAPKAGPMHPQAP